MDVSDCLQGPIGQSGRNPTEAKKKVTCLRPQLIQGQVYHFLSLNEELVENEHVYLATAATVLELCKWRRLAVSCRRNRDIN